MKITATHKNARIAPRKVRPLAAALRGMNVVEAQAQLPYMPSSKVNSLVLEVLKSAVANAEHNFDMKAEDLTIENILVNSGIVFHRYNPVSKGMAHPIQKRTSHITVELTSSAKPAKKSKKKSDIVTISADQYAAEELEDHDHESHASEEDKVKKAAKPTEEVSQKQSESRKGDDLEAYSKTKMQQKGGDKAKTHRRSSNKEN